MTRRACGGRYLDLSRPQVMGVLNVTPDSFSDGGRFFTLAAALDGARRMAGAGAALLDIGGESSRPGALPISENEELDRVIPVIEALARELPIPLSIDTSKPAVMTAAIAAGAGFINDIQALRTPGALAAAAHAGVPVCLMHMRGEPRTMQHQPLYHDVVAEVCDFLTERIDACIMAGIPRERLVIDPGFGFGKTLEHNLTLFKQLHQFREFKLPLLVGVSRKALLGALLNNKPPAARLAGGLAAAVLAVQAGAVLIRTHDVGATVDALCVAEMLGHGA